MDYDARKDSLLSEQESEKVEIYLACRKIDVPVVAVQAHLQEGNKPRKGIYHSKPTQNSNSRVDFANSIVIEYFFQCNCEITQIAKNYSSRFTTPLDPIKCPLEESKQQLESSSTAGRRESSKRSAIMGTSSDKCTLSVKRSTEEPSVSYSSIFSLAIQMWEALSYASDREEPGGSSSRSGEMSNIYCMRVR